MNAKHGHKPDGQQAGANGLAGKGEDDGQLQQPGNVQAAAAGAFAGQLHLPDTQLPPHQQGKADSQCGEPQATQLDAGQNHSLAKGCPQCEGVAHHQARHTGGRGDGEQSVNGSGAPHFGRDGQHQQQRSHQNNQHKADDDDPHRRRGLDSFVYAML